MSRTLLEAGLLLGAATLAGLLANALNRDGLKLSEDYLRLSPPGAGGGAEAGAGAEGRAGSGAPEHGFQRMHLEDLREKVDWRYFEASPDLGSFLLDARKESAWRAGHLPQAICVDPYHPERYLTPELLSALKKAAEIVIYCGGGDCTDSILLARHLVYGGPGIPMESVFLYEGGYQEWTSKGLLVEGAAGR